MNRILGTARVENFRYLLIRAMRSVIHVPGFSVSAIGTLSLALCAVTTIFAIVDAVILRPLPYPSASRLVSVFHPTRTPGTGEIEWGLSTAGYFAFARATRTLESFGAYTTASYTVLRDNGLPERVRVAEVTASLLQTLGARPVLGRSLTEADDRPGAPRSILLSHDYWNRQFGGDSAVLGRSLTTTDGVRQIVGILQNDFSLPKPGPYASPAALAGFGVDVWECLQLDPAAPAENSHQFAAVGRLRPGVPLEQAQADFTHITSGFTDLFPTVYTPRFIENYRFGTKVLPLKEHVLGPQAPRGLWLLMIVVGIILIVACVNVATLVLVRVQADRRNSAIRAAMGATNAQIMMTYAAESTMLTLVAAVIGFALARLAVPILVYLAPPSIPRIASASGDWRTAAAALVAWIIISVLLGQVPRLRDAISPAALREGRGQSASHRHHRTRSMLVGFQTAMALVLLVTSGLLARSFMLLHQVQPGMDVNQVLSFDVNLPPERYSTIESATDFHRELQSRIGALPGVVRVGVTTKLPFRDYGLNCAVVFREKLPYAKNEAAPCVATSRITPGFVETLRIPVRGRALTWSDVAERTQAAIITRALAERLWPGEDPIGKGINSNGAMSDAGFYRIVGVIPAIRAAGLDQPPSEAVFFPPTRLNVPTQSQVMRSVTYVVRTSGDSPTSLLPAVRRTIAAIDREIAVANPRVMREVVARSIAQISFLAFVLASAAFLTLILSAVGIYGVVAFVVGEQRGDIGIRRALGARGSDIMTLVLRRSLTVAAGGTVVGLLVTLVVSRVLSAFIFGVRAFDPLVMSLGVAVMVITSIAAAAIPTRRALHVDAVEAIAS